MMRHSAPIAKATRTTWRVSVTEIAAALGLPADERCWFVLENAEDDGSSEPLSGDVDVVRWVPLPPHTYQDELAKPGKAGA
jgi:hypothetical protein